jgi:hypothetical protein
MGSSAGFTSSTSRYFEVKQCAHRKKRSRRQISEGESRRGSAAVIAKVKKFVLVWLGTRSQIVPRRASAQSH